MRATWSVLASLLVGTLAPDQRTSVRPPIQFDTDRL